MTTWKIDKAHSEVKFKAKHLVVSTVSGHFNSFDATIETSATDFSDFKASFEADIDSISTKNDQRDGHLKSPDFFDAASHPKLTFVSTGITNRSGNEFTLNGDLTIRGVTKPIALKVTYNGTVAGFGGVEVAGFEISGKIKRLEYGLNWNAVTEAGGIVVSDDITLEIAAEFNKA